MAPVRQISPHPPQLLGFVCSLTHVPLHRVKPALQLATHCPLPLQLAPAAFGSLVVHWTLHPPQLLESVAVLTQAALQQESPPPPTRIWSHAGPISCQRPSELQSSGCSPLHWAAAGAHSVHAPLEQAGVLPVQGTALPHCPFDPQV